MESRQHIRDLIVRLTVAVGLVSAFHISPFGSEAHAQYRVTHLEKPYNTPGSETGAIRVGDTILAYSSMQPSKGRRNKHFGFGGSQTMLYQARIARNGKVARPRPSRWGLNSRRDHTSNLAIDPLTHDLYFTRCAMDRSDLRCDIWWARKLRRGWDEPRRLGGGVNLREHTATQPAVGRVDDTTAILYFVSDRPGGMGGMDVWYALVRNGTAEEPVNLGPQVNTAADEITPFYDQRNGVLYFSSDRAGGKGGHDVYCAVGRRNTWRAAEPVCGCLNSEQNDIYFAVTDHDSASGMPTAGYLSSNRPDSYYVTDSLCCYDIYRWEIDSTQLYVAPPEPADTVDTASHTPQVAERSPFMFPLMLYFHNDEPDPRSRDSVTETSYTDCQRRYAALRDDYLSRQATAEDSARMAMFFDTCVVGNYHRVEALFDYIEEQLDEGHTVQITVKGFASPVFTDDYNRMLSARRIGSVINMIRAWRGGMFADAMEDKRLTLVLKPMGIDSKSTQTAPNDPVYSLQSAMARRIEILDCEVQ